MSHSINVHVSVIGDTPLPACDLSGTRGDIPTVTFEDSSTARANVTISLGSHPNPGAYLMGLAERLAEFALEVDGAAQPIPYVLTEKAAGQ